MRVVFFMPEGYFETEMIYRSCCCRKGESGLYDCREKTREESYFLFFSGATGGRYLDTDVVKVSEWRLRKVKDIYKEIVEYIVYQKNSGEKETFRTREIADAVGLTIYQARLHLETLQSLGVVEKINSGKGVPGLWELR